MQAITPKMTVEIWSDIMCPFCYLGKRKFEKALQSFEHKDAIEIIWKSFQLMPDLKTNPNIHIDEFLSTEKGFPLEQAKQLNSQITERALQEGLEYNFDKAVVANSFNAHRFLHFAKAKELQGIAKEQLLKAYFTNGKNIDDNRTLLELGVKIGLDQSELASVLTSNDYADEVEKDIYEARQLRIQGVPFFVFDRKYGVSGAQETSIFTQTLEQAFTQWDEQHNTKIIQIAKGENCTIDGHCD